MELGSFNLNTLPALQALLAEGNLTYAGAKVGLSQPAMSGILARFRRHYNDELLVRVGRDYELTPLARDLLPHVQVAVRLLRQTLGVDDTFNPTSSDRLFTIAASDYALTVLVEPLRRRVREQTSAVRLAFIDLPDDLVGSSEALLRQDLLIGPLGYGFEGESRFLFHDRLVCMVDRRNPYLRNGGLELDALRQMPHAIAGFRGAHATPVDRILSQKGVPRRVALRALGFLPLPFAVAGTDAVAVVPERLARRFQDDDRLLILEAPFGFVEMLEAAWWHPSRSMDPGHGWLLGLVAEVAAELQNAEPGGVARA